MSVWWLIALLGILIMGYALLAMKPEQQSGIHYEKLESLLMTYSEQWVSENERVIRSVDEKHQDARHKMRQLNERLRRLEIVVHQHEDISKSQRQLPGERKQDNGTLPLNDPIIRLYQQGKPVQAIAKQLNKGTGEVQLAITIFEQSKGD